MPDINLSYKNYFLLTLPSTLLGTLFLNSFLEFLVVIHLYVITTLNFMLWVRIGKNILSTNKENVSFILLIEVGTKFLLLFGGFFLAGYFLNAKITIFVINYILHIIIVGLYLAKGKDKKPEGIRA